MKAGLVFPILFIWIFFTLGFLFSVSHLIKDAHSSRSLSLLLADSSRNLPRGIPNYSQTKKGVVSALVSGKDARAVLINRFLGKYGSPMAGMGDTVSIGGSCRPSLFKNPTSERKYQKALIIPSAGQSTKASLLEFILKVGPAVLTQSPQESKKTILIMVLLPQKRSLQSILPGTTLVGCLL